LLCLVDDNTLLLPPRILTMDHNGQVLRNWLFEGPYDSRTNNQHVLITETVWYLSSIIMYIRDLEQNVCIYLFEYQLEAIDFIAWIDAIFRFSWVSILLYTYNNNYIISNIKEYFFLYTSIHISNRGMNELKSFWLVTELIFPTKFLT